MSKQRPDPDKIANELVGASSFFKPSASTVTTPSASPVVPPTVATHEPAPSTNPTTSSTEAAQETRSPSIHDAEKSTRTPRTPERPQRRHMIRHAFELYLDQLDSLRELADAQRRRGEPASMSRMVREAIDHFLDQQSSQIE